VEIVAGVAASERDLGGGIGGGAASNDDSTDGLAGDEAGKGGPRGIRGGLAGVVVRGAGVADPGYVEEGGGEDVGFFDAGYLLAEGFEVGAVEIGSGGSDVAGVVDGVGAGEGVAGGEVAVEAEGAEVIANDLERGVEDFGDATEVGRGGIGRGPEIQKRSDAGSDADVDES
jgi:hypothetical protein